MRVLDTDVIMSRWRERWGERETESEREREWAREGAGSGAAQETMREAIGPAERVLGSGGKRGKVPQTMSCLMEVAGDLGLW
jgi:hypothetical protein